MSSLENAETQEDFNDIQTQLNNNAVKFHKLADESESLNMKIKHYRKDSRLKNAE